SSRRRHTRLQGDWSSDVCSSDLKSETIQETSSRTRQHRTPSFPSGQAAALRRDKTRFFATPGYFRGTVLRRVCGPRYRRSIRTISQYSRVHHEAAASDVEAHDKIRRHAEHALLFRTAHRWPK